MKYSKKGIPKKYTTPNLDHIYHRELKDITEDEFSTFIMLMGGMKYESEWRINSAYVSLAIEFNSREKKKYPQYIIAIYYNIDWYIPSIKITGLRLTQKKVTELLSLTESELLELYPPYVRTYI